MKLNTASSHHLYLKVEKNSFINFNTTYGAVEQRVHSPRQIFMDEDFLSSTIRVTFNWHMLKMCVYN